MTPSEELTRVLAIVKRRREHYEAKAAEADALNGDYSLREVREHTMEAMEHLEAELIALSRGSLTSSDFEGIKLSELKVGE